jgi:competence protein ComEC
VKLDAQSGERPDLRMVVIGAAAWTGGLVGLLAPVLLPVVLLAGLALVVVRRRRQHQVWMVLCCLLVGTAVAAGALLRSEMHRRSPVADLAGVEAVVTLDGRVTSDPVRKQGRYGPYVLARMTVQRLEGRGRAYEVRVPVLVIGGVGWLDAELGETVRTVGRLQAAEDLSLAAVVGSARDPTPLEPAAAVFDAADSVRSGIRAAVAWADRDARALIPALVVGDDHRMADQVVADFRTCGLTHLAAVSGTNLTLVVGFLLVLARWAGVRSRGLVLVGLVGVAGFVILARPEPSVVRAAAMGSVALVGMGSNGRRKGARAAGVAVFALLLYDPWLAVSFGFVLSVLATAGILFLAPGFRDQLMGWLPRWAAEAVAVPFAAQLACTPVVAVLSGQVSLVAVVANLAVAPAVGPATVLGLLGGLMMLVLPTFGQACGWVAGLFGSWIVAVATQLATLPQAAVDWSTGPVAVTALAAMCLLIAVHAGHVLRRPAVTAVVAALLALVTLRPLPAPGWPPDDWLMVACDVGQGDGLVFNAGNGRAIVVDAGPDPSVIDRCLERLGVERVPVVVLTHFHADHVTGLPGVLRDRPGSRVVVTGLAEPEWGARRVRRWSARADVELRNPALGETHRLGAVTWQVIAPPGRLPAVEGQGSLANNASLVLLVEVHGVRILATGDIEPEAQQVLLRSYPDLEVDVLKVPHHGSRYQDPALLTGLGASLALISAGADNDYGHPAPETIDVLQRAGVMVRSTSEVGAIAVVLDDSRRLRVATR